MIYVNRVIASVSPKSQCNVPYAMHIHTCIERQHSVALRQHIHIHVLTTQHNASELGWGDTAQGGLCLCKTLYCSQVHTAFITLRMYSLWRLHSL